MAEGIEYHVRAILEAAESRKLSKMDRWASNLAGASQKVESVGRQVMGTTAQTAMMWGKVAGGIAVAAGVGGLGAMVAGGIQLNKQMEEVAFSVGSTLQLMNRNSGAADQWSANLEEARWAMEDLERRAATSPASFEQAQDLFKNMLPGAAQVETSMEKILDLSEAALTLGVQLGGDYQQAGADLRRILTGQAGGDVRAWAEGLATPIREAGIEAGHWNDSMAIGQDLTQQFNKLKPEERYKLVTKAVMNLAPATKYAGQMWTGLTSTIMTDLKILQRELGRSSFEKFKEMWGRLGGKGGVLDPKGETFGKLENAASFFGEKIGAAAEKLGMLLERGITYVANNWQTIYDRLHSVFTLALRAAKLYLKFAAARTVLGAGMVGAGKAGKGAASIANKMKPATDFLKNAAYKSFRTFKMLGGGMKGMQGAAAMFGKSLMSIGSALLFALPIALVLGAALVGVFAVVGAAIAYFVSQWDKIILGFQDGTLSLAPLMDALEVAWDGFVRVGAALFGGAEVGDTFSGVVYFMTDAVYFLIAAFQLGMKTLGAFQFLWNIFMIGLQSVYLGIVGILRGILGAFTAIVSKVGQAIADVAPDSVAMPIINLGAKLAAAGAKVDTHMKGVVGSMKEDARDATQLWKAADRMSEGQSSGKWAASADEWMKKQRKASGGPGAPGGAGGGAKVPAGNTTHIHKMEVHQDLRNMDPDRVIGAFYRAVDRSVEKRTQAYTVQEQGI